MKKLFIFILIAALLVSSALAIVSFASGESGTKFGVNELYRSTAPLSAAPRTFEAVIKVDKNAGTSRLGVMAGNYGAAAAQFTTINFEIRDGGKPSVWWCLAGKSSTRVDFDVDIRTGEEMHLAITVSQTEAKCYINGELKDTKTGSFADPPASTLANIAVGGDLRAGNVQNLKNSELYSVALFSDVRSADTIKSDMNSVDTGADALVAYYDLTAEGKERLKDNSKNENHLSYVDSKDSSKNESYIEDTMKEGYTFDSQHLYKLVNVPNKTPHTFEAEIYFPKNTPSTERGGVIFGNYGGATRCISFEIYTNGAPRIYWTNDNGIIVNAVFNKVNLYSGEWTHLTVTVDNEADKAYCYVNGELAQTVNYLNASDSLCPDTFAIGGDLRSGNAQNFKGRIKSIAVYSDVRSADEIKKDVSTLDRSDLIAAYDLEGIEEGTYPDYIEDLSDNKNNAKLKKYWIEKVDSDFEYSYSFAVIGDTQIVARSYPKEFPKIYDYILDNLEKKNIKMVMGLGDITDADSAAEWTLAKNNIARLNGKVPYSLVRGNHDSSVNFRNSFAKSGYKEGLGGMFNNELENTWQELVVGEVKYLIMTLDYGARDAVLNWAGEVIEAHPEHNVIITTHAYLFRDGTTLDVGDVCPPSKSGGTNNGDHIWRKLISKHDNIVLVLSGHDPCDEVVMTKTEGKNGRIVTQMLIDPQGVDDAQGATGMVAMFYFSEDGKKLRVEYYSTARDLYFMEENQFETELDLVEAKNDEPITPPVTTPAPMTSVQTPVTSTPKSEVTTNAPVTGAPVTSDDTSDEKLGFVGFVRSVMLPIMLPAILVIGAVIAVIIIIKKKK